MSRLLAFDLDGTLLTDDKTVPEDSARALARLRDLGCRTVVITGRDRVPRDVLEAARPDGWATNNGGTVSVGGETRTEAGFTPEELRAVLAVALPEARVVAYGRDTLYLDPQGGEAPAWLAERALKPLRDAEGEHILKVAVYHPQAADWAGQLRASQPHLTFTGAQEPYVEFLTVTPTGADKGAALVALAEALSVPLAATVAFGDSDNDVAMLELAGLAVQVGDLPLLAPHADAQVDSPEALGGWLSAFADQLAAERAAPTVRKGVHP